MKSPINYNGKEYTKLKDLAEATGINISTLSNRLSRGWSIEKALSTPVKSIASANTPITYKGKEYPSLLKLCNALDINKSTVERRIVDGEALDDAIDHCIGLKTREQRVIYVDDIPYKTWGDIVEEYGVSATTLARLMKDNRICSEDIREIIRNRDKHKTLIKFEGEDYEGLPALVKAKGCNYSRVYSRLRLGWSLEEAIYGKRIKHAS